MKWISIKDKFPERGRFVLAYGPGCQGWVNGPFMCICNYGDNAWWDANLDAEYLDEKEGGKVTHWMLLPKPPREKP